VGTHGSRCSRPNNLTNLTNRYILASMARTVTIGEAKTNFSKLVRRAEAGEEIVVRRGLEPVARIMPLKKGGGVHGFGSMKGEIRIGPDFGEPLEDFA
jgi:prevent-host-death family protein